MKRWSTPTIDELRISETANGHKDSPVEIIKEGYEHTDGRPKYTNGSGMTPSAGN